MEISTVDVTSLRLDLSNYRIFHTLNQADAIKAMVEVQGIKIAEMAEDIAEYGLSPIDISAVSEPDENGMYTVFEGNRRATALKLLDTPALAGDPAIERRINRARPKFLKNRITSIPCAVFKEREEAMHWVDRKQGSGLGGAGLDRWAYVANSRRKADRGVYERWIAAVDFLRRNGEPMEKVEFNLEKYQIGALIERVFTSKYLGSHLGVKISATSGEVTFEDGDVHKGCTLLKTAIEDFINERPSTDTYRFAEDTEAFWTRYSDLSAKKPSDEEEAPEGGNSDDASDGGNNITGSDDNDNDDHDEDAVDDKKKKRRPKRRRSGRATLAPKDKALTLFIHHDRINDLYHDLRNLSITENGNKGLRNVAPVMLRVFLDLTLTHYLIAKSVPLTKEVEHRRKSAWDEAGVTLPQKLKATLNHIDPSGSKRTLKSVRQALQKDFSHSIQVLHENVHDLDANILTQREIAEYWDRYHPIFQEIYEILDK